MIYFSVPNQSFFRKEVVDAVLSKTKNPVTVSLGLSESDFFFWVLFTFDLFGRYFLIFMWHGKRWYKTDCS